jgi:ABC-2 type transport system ATP-binding protein
MTDHSVSSGAATGADTVPARRPDDVVVGRGIVKRWGSVTALSGASFTIRRGITGLLGTNGAGKTTLLGMMLGLHRPTEGTLEVLGFDPVRAGAAVRERVGYSPEHHTLPADTSAQDLDRHLAEVHGLPFREATGRASDALWQVGLGEERFRPIGTMSTGQRQRVKLAQAIAHDPQLVLLDEPTDGLDPVQRDDMLALIHRVGTEFGIDIILSSHLLEEVERVCDQAVIIAGGGVVASGPIAELTGADRGLLVEVDDHAPALVDAIRAASPDLRVELDGSRLVVTRSVDGTRSVAGADDDLYDLVRDALATTGAGLRRLTNRTVSLEDVFLEVGT